MRIWIFRVAIIGHLLWLMANAQYADYTVLSTLVFSAFILGLFIIYPFKKGLTK